MALEPLPPAEGSDALDIVEPLCAVFRRTLKGEGLKYTPERAHVLDAIVRADGLFQAEQLIDAMRRSGARVSKATVYRTIRLLMDAGIVQRVPFDDDQGLYQLVYGRRPHDLIIHVDSNRVETIEVPELAALRDRLCAARGLVAKGHSFQIFAMSKPR